MQAFKRSHLRLLVAEFKKCFAFYRDVLGLPVRYGDENTDYAEFKTDAVHIALFKRHLMAQAVGGDGRFPADAETQDRLAIVLRVDDVDAEYARLKSRGAQFVTAPQDRRQWGCRTAHLRDPDGNLLELNSDL